MLLAVVLALSGLGSAGAGAASAAPGYRLAFGSTIDTSASGGPLIVKGHRSDTTQPMIADQIIDNETGLDPVRAGIGQLVYEEWPGSLSHRHWHYKAFVRYQLRSASDLSLVRPDTKAGFCLSDPDYAPDFCDTLNRNALTVDEGLGPGTSDYYPPTLEGQYIDVTGVPPGDYWLVHWVNSGKEICERDYANNASAVKMTLWPNGYGVAPYFTQKETLTPFHPSFYADLTPPDNCDQASTPGFGAPDLTPKTPAELGITAVGLGDARLCVPAKAKAGKSRIGPARIRRSGKVFKTRYRPGRRKGRVIRYCLRNKAKGRFYVGSTRKGVIEFVASTARRHSTRKYRPGKRVKSGRIRGTRRIARGVFLGRGKRSRAVYGVRRGRVTFVAAVSRNQWRKPRRLVKRLRALKLTPKATAKRKPRRG